MKYGPASRGDNRTRWPIISLRNILFVIIIIITILDAVSHTRTWMSSFCHFCAYFFTCVLVLILYNLWFMAHFQCTLLSLYHPHNKVLTHWGRETHICVSILTIIGSDNGLSPGRRQAIIWTSAGILLIGPLGTYFNEILIEIHTFSFKKMHLKISSAKWRPFCLGLNVLTDDARILTLFGCAFNHLHVHCQ